MTDNELTHAIIGAAMEVHRTLGPGLPEKAYDECLAREFAIRGMPQKRQNPLPVIYKDLKLECGYRPDCIVWGRVVVELKAIEALAPVHDSIMLTYLRMSSCRVGLLINFNVKVLKDGIRRLVLGPLPEAEKTNHRGHRETEGTENE
jgi:GxxExxY protein